MRRIFALLAVLLVFSFASPAYAQGSIFDSFADWFSSVTGFANVARFESSSPSGSDSSSCTETDGGASYYTSGSITANGQTGYDYCYSTSQVYENYCYNGTAQAYIYSCTYGCSNGACSSAPAQSGSSSTAPTYPDPTCTDSESGATQNVKGTITYTSQGSNYTYTDYCSGSTIVDYYCIGNSLNTTYITCQYGCSNGVCTSAPTASSAPNQSPTVSITTTASSATSPANIIINATASDDKAISKVEFYNGTTKIGEDTIYPYSFTWNSAGSGTYAFSAKATDNETASATSNTSTITIANPSTSPQPTTSTSPNPSANPPTLSAKALAKTTYTADEAIVVELTASDSDGIAKTEVLANGTPKSTKTTSPHTHTLTGLSAGTYTLTAKATDNTGQVSTLTVGTVTTVAGGFNSVEYVITVSTSDNTEPQFKLLNNNGNTVSAYRQLRNKFPNTNEEFSQYAFSLNKDETYTAIATAQNHSDEELTFQATPKSYPFAENIIIRLEMTQKGCLTNPTNFWDQETDKCFFGLYSSQIVKALCSDPDMGINLNKQAHTFGFRSHFADDKDKRIRTGGRDACLEGNSIVEYYCDSSGYIETTYQTCPNGCKDGACVGSANAPSVCSGFSKIPIGRSVIGSNGIILTLSNGTGFGLQGVVIKATLSNGSVVEGTGFSSKNPGSMAANEVTTIEFPAILSGHVTADFTISYNDGDFTRSATGRCIGIATNILEQITPGQVLKSDVFVRGIAVGLTTGVGYVEISNTLTGNKESYNEGDKIEGLIGAGRYEGKEMIVKVVQIVQSGASANTYAATFELYDDQGKLVDTQTAGINTNLKEVFRQPVAHSIDVFTSNNSEAQLSLIDSRNQVILPFEIHPNRVYLPGLPTLVSSFLFYLSPGQTYTATASAKNHFSEKITFEAKNLNNINEDLFGAITTDRTIQIKLKSDGTAGTITTEPGSILQTAGEVIKLKNGESATTKSGIKLTLLDGFEGILEVQESGREVETIWVVTSKDAPPSTTKTGTTIQYDSVDGEYYIFVVRKPARYSITFVDESGKLFNNTKIHEVTVCPIDLSCYTQADLGQPAGNPWEISEATLGTYSWIFNSEGYEDAKLNFTLKQGDNLKFTVVMKKKRTTPQTQPYDFGPLYPRNSTQSLTGKDGPSEAKFLQGLPEGTFGKGYPEAVFYGFKDNQDRLLIEIGNQVRGLPSATKGGLQFRGDTNALRTIPFYVKLTDSNYGNVFEFEGKDVWYSMRFGTGTGGNDISNDYNVLVSNGDYINGNQWTIENDGRTTYIRFNGKERHQVFEGAFLSFDNVRAKIEQILPGNKLIISVDTVLELRLNHDTGTQLYNTAGDTTDASYGLMMLSNNEPVITSMAEQLIPLSTNDSARPVYYTAMYNSTTDKLFLLLFADKFGSGQGDKIQFGKSIEFLGTNVPYDDGVYIERNKYPAERYYVPKDSDFSSATQNRGVFTSPNAYFVAHFNIVDKVSNGNIIVYIDTANGGNLGPFPNANLSEYSNDVEYTDHPKWNLTSGNQQEYLKAAYTDAGTKVWLLDNDGGVKISSPERKDEPSVLVYRPFPKNSLVQQKVNNGDQANVSTQMTLIESVGADADIKFDTTLNIKDLVAKIDSGDFYYKTTIGTNGIDLGGTEFVDGADDNVRIDFFWEEYELAHARLTGTKYVKLTKRSAKESYNEGETIEGLVGDNSYAGQEIAVKIVQIVQSEADPNFYKATFELYDKSGKLIDVQTVTTGTNLRDAFKDNASNLALRSNLFVDTLAIGAATGVGYVEVTKGNDTIELYDGKSYPYDSTSNGIDRYRVSIETAPNNPNALLSIKIYNYAEKWTSNRDTAGEIARPQTTIQRSNSTPAERIEPQGFRIPIVSDILDTIIGALFGTSSTQTNSTAAVCGDNVCDYGEEQICTADCRPAPSPSSQPNQQTQNTSPTSTFEIIQPAQLSKSYTAIISQALPDPIRPEAGEEFYIKGTIKCTDDCEGRVVNLHEGKISQDHTGLSAVNEDYKNEQKITLKEGDNPFTLGPFRSGEKNRPIAQTTLCSGLVLQGDDGSSYAIPIEVGVKPTEQYCARYSTCDNYVEKIEGICFQDYFRDVDYDPGYSYYQMKMDIFAQLPTIIEDQSAQTIYTKEVISPSNTTAMFAGDIIPSEVQRIESELAEKAGRMGIVDSLITELEAERTAHVRGNKGIRFTVPGGQVQKDITYASPLSKYEFPLGEQRLFHERNMVSLITDLEIHEKSIRFLKNDLADAEKELATFTRSGLSTSNYEQVRGNTQFAAAIKEVEDIRIDLRARQSVALTLKEAQTKLQAHITKTIESPRLYLVGERTKVANEIKEIAARASGKYASYASRFVKFSSQALKWTGKALGITALISALTQVPAIGADVKDGKYGDAADKTLDNFIVYSAAKGIAVTGKEIEQFMGNSGEARSLRYEIQADIESDLGESILTANGKKVKVPGTPSKNVQLEKKMAEFSQQLIEWKRKQQEGK